MDRASEERFSVIVIRAVDSLGYSDVCVKTRQDFWRERVGRHQPVDTDPSFTRIIAGSKAEGTSLSYESDIDQIASINDLVCSDNIPNINMADYQASFHMDTDNVPAGYTRLRHTDFGRVREMARPGQLLSSVCYATVEHNGGHFLSSASWVPPGHKRSGPAVSGDTVLNTLGNLRFTLSADMVLAIPCSHESMLQDWIKRPRHHGWPTKEAIQRISKLQGHVVPVGFKGTNDESLQWRICYTQAEVALVHELNHVQSVLFILMKKISKQLLKPVCSDITSYIIKNIVLWMAEMHSREKFVEINLMSVIMDCLKILLEAVQTKYLANYMLSKRNLFTGKLEHDHEQQNLCERISTMIEQGPRFLVQYPEFVSLKKRMQLVYREPDVALFEQINREKNEICRYDKCIGGSMNPWSTPCMHTVLFFCRNHGYPKDMAIAVAEKLHLYLDGYFYFQTIS